MNTLNISTYTDSGSTARFRKITGHYANNYFVWNNANDHMLNLTANGIIYNAALFVKVKLLLNDTHLVSFQQIINVNMANQEINYSETESFAQSDQFQVDRCCLRLVCTIIDSENISISLDSLPATVQGWIWIDTIETPIL